MTGDCDARSTVSALSAAPSSAPSGSRLRPRSRGAAVAAIGGVALTALLGATAVWLVTAKNVSLTVDGATRSVSLHGSHVSDVLAAEGLVLGAHDRLAPAADRPVSDGDTVSLRHGRELKLVVDGVARSVWVTAGDVDGALQEAGVRADGAALSASRSRSIGLDGMSLDVRMPKQTSVTVDGVTTPRTTTAATVGDLLGEATVVLRPADTLSVPAETPVTEGLAVTVVRNDSRDLVEDAAVPFDTVRTPDPQTAVGTERVTVVGRPGSERRTFALAVQDGKEVSRTLSSTVRTAEPVAQQVAVGSMPKPAPAAAPPAAPAAAPAPRPTPAPAPAPAPASGGGGPVTGGLNWGALAQCESGGNPRAVGGGGLYFGLYQFSFSTWAGVGGSGNPADASPAEQTSRASILYGRSGRSPWPVCGRFL